MESIGERERERGKEMEKVIGRDVGIEIQTGDKSENVE